MPPDPLSREAVVEAVHELEAQIADAADRMLRQRARGQWLVLTVECDRIRELCDRRRALVGGA